jgi:hypothetical protein
MGIGEGRLRTGRLKTEYGDGEESAKNDERLILSAADGYTVSRGSGVSCERADCVIVLPPSGAARVDTGARARAQALKTQTGRCVTPFGNSVYDVGSCC